MQTAFPDCAETPQKVITVVQGEYHISADPNVMLSTILGSCVSVCIFDVEAGIGGMNHFLLPGRAGDESASVKYGTFAMESLINELLKAGADRFHLQAKLFGGARMTANGMDIGASNVVFGQKFLADEGIICVASSVGGTQARRVQFTPSNGAARQRFVASSEVAPRVAPVLPTASEVTLF